MKVSIAELAEKCYPEDVMIGTEDKELNARVKARVLAQIGASPRRHRGRTVRLTLLLAAVFALLAVTAYAAGLFRMNREDASAADLRGSIWRRADSSPDAPVYDYAEDGLTFTFEGDGPAHAIEVRPGWLPGEPTHVSGSGGPAYDWSGWYDYLIRDLAELEPVENPTDLRTIPYMISCGAAYPGHRLVLAGDYTIVKEEDWDGLSVTEVTLLWQEERGVENYVILFHPTEGYLVIISGGAELETLERIARELEIRETGVLEAAPAPNGTGMINIGRG